MENGSMIYLHAYTTSVDGRQTVAIAVVEEARHAERYELQGYTRCTRETFRAAWQLRDACALARLHAAAITANQVTSSRPDANQHGIYRALN
jgi:hypothetical protein